jgi:hypothetical protein
LTYWDARKGKRTVRNCLMKSAELQELKNRVYQAYLSGLARAKRAECEEKRKWAITECRKEKRWVINQQLIATEEEFKERNPR